jgi:NDP-sugar pyrophosphorylase family protein
MKAMILAAGLGTRLRPLTDDRPKALVEINGRTLLEITLSRLRTFGVHEVIVNLHHFGDMVVDYLKKNENFGMTIEISREDVLLDRHPEEPFIVHNVDVLSTIDLQRMVQFHDQHQALATLAVQDRKTSRYLLFDDHLQLWGRRSGSDQEPDLVRPSRPRSSEQTHALAFSGIHVISPRFLTMMTEEGAFSIITSYLRLAAQGEKVLAFRADDYYWRDLGKPENLAQAALDLEQNVIAQ